MFGLLFILMMARIDDAFRHRFTTETLAMLYKTLVKAAKRPTCANTRERQDADFREDPHREDHHSRSREQ